MDYGVYLKKELKVNNKKSKHYTKQSKFEGSKRQVRGSIIRILSKMKKLREEDLFMLVEQEIPENNHSVEQVIEDLLSEKLIFKEKNNFYL